MPPILLLSHIPRSKLSNLTPASTSPFMTNSINPFKRVELSPAVRPHLSRLFPAMNVNMSFGDLQVRAEIIIYDFML